MPADYGQEAIDNDDGSAYYNTHHNYFAYAGTGMKNVSNFATALQSRLNPGKTLSKALPVASPHPTRTLTLR